MPVWAGRHAGLSSRGFWRVRVGAVTSTFGTACLFPRLRRPAGRRENSRYALRQLPPTTPGFPSAARGARLPPKVLVTAPTLVLERMRRST